MALGELPDYPWDQMAPYAERARRHADGIVDLSIGSPVDPTPTLIRDALDEIKRTENVAIDIDAITLDDPKTYELFGNGQTYGVFQCESSGMRELLRKAKPERLDDLIALNALYRPGPLKSGMVDDYIARKQG